MIKKKKCDSGVNIFVKCHNANNNIKCKIMIKNYKKKILKNKEQVKNST